MPTNTEMKVRLEDHYHQFMDLVFSVASAFINFSLELVQRGIFDVENFVLLGLYVLYLWSRLGEMSPMKLLLM